MKNGGLILLIICGLGLAGCVDEAYDLSTLDKTIVVGGDITIPESSTGYYSLAKMLNLDEESSVYANEDGDYIIQKQAVTISSAFNITDITLDIPNRTVQFVELPKLLRDDETCLDVDNPKIYLEVANASQAYVTLTPTLTAIKSDEVIATIVIPSFEIAPGNHNICISAKSVSESGVTQNVVASNLPDLVKRLPDNIGFKATAECDLHGAAFSSSDANTFDMDINVDFPLVFGDELSIVYCDIKDDYDTSIDGISWYMITVDIVAENTIPMDMTITAEPFFTEGSERDRSVTATIAAGTIDSPSTSEFSITVRGYYESVGEFDHLEYSFKGTNESGNNSPMNENQAIRFTSVKTTLTGGVQLDLN